MTAWEAPAVEGLKVDPKTKGLRGEMVRLVTEDGLISLEIDLTGDRSQPSGSGHTSFVTKHGVRTYDRIGVDDSFYVTDWKTKGVVENLAEILTEQVKRARESIERINNSVIVPGLTFSPTLTAAQVEEHREKLRKKLSVSFAPGGFGTGHVILTKKTRWSRPAKKELVDFFNVGPLYVEDFDHD